MLPKIYPIIDTSLTPLNKISDLLTAIIDGGAQIIQLRAKALSSGEFLKSARTIRELTRKAGLLFIVNDRVDVAILADADGVHLGQDDLPVERARKLLGNTKIIGYSTHNIKEALKAKRLPVDYISFGPVFPTKTKTDAQTPTGLKGLSEAEKAVNMPIVAVGGISEANLAYVLKEGVASAAIISDITASPDIAEKIKRLNIIANGPYKQG